MDKRWLNSKKYFSIISKLKNHGQSKNYNHDIVGYNSRLDSVNAFVLNEKLAIFKQIKDSINYSVGFSDVASLNSKIAKGMTLMKVHTYDEESFKSIPVISAPRAPESKCVFIILIFIIWLFFIQN